MEGGSPYWRELDLDAVQEHVQNGAVNRQLPCLVCTFFVNFGSSHFLLFTLVVCTSPNGLSFRHWHVCASV
jgi:hypothetical protein